MTSTYTIDLPENIAPPTTCPSCKTATVIEGDWPMCPNYHCNMRVRGRIQKFVDVLDVKGVGELTLVQMVEQGLVKTPADLFDIDLPTYLKLDRVGDKHFAKMQQGLENARDMSTAQFFASLDIEGLGTWEAITVVPGLSTIDDIVHAATHDRLKFAQAVRVSPEKAMSITQQIVELADDIEALRKHVRFKVAGTKLMGKCICITGSLSQPRPKVEKKIKDAGGQVSSSVTARTTHLVIDDLNSTSSKAKKARELRILMISEAQLMEMFN